MLKSIRKTEREIEREFERDLKRVIKQNIKIEEKEKYNTKKYRIFFDDNYNDLKPIDNVIPMLRTDTITIKKYIGKRLEINDFELRFLTLKLSVDTDDWGINEVSIQCNIDGKTISRISPISYTYTINDEPKDVYNKDIQNILDNINRGCEKIINHYNVNN